MHLWSSSSTIRSDTKSSWPNVSLEMQMCCKQRVFQEAIYGQRRRPESFWWTESTNDMKNNRNMTEIIRGDMREQEASPSAGASCLTARLEEEDGTSPRQRRWQSGLSVCKQDQSPSHQKMRLTPLPIRWAFIFLTGGGEGRGLFNFKIIKITIATIHTHLCFLYSTMTVIILVSV